MKEDLLLNMNKESKTSTQQRSNESIQQRINTATLKDSNLIVQANKLVNARYKLSLQEGRLLLAAMSLIKPGDEDLKKYKINISDLATYLEISGGNIYNSLSAITDNLVKRFITIEDEEGWRKFPLLHQAEFRKSDNSITIQFHSEMKPLLLQQTGSFTQATLKNLIKYGNSYTARMYMFLKERLHRGKRTVLVDELKSMLALSNYGYNDLYRRVLEPVQAEMECYSDISFQILEGKKGKKGKIDKITFLIHPNTPIMLLEMSKEISAEIIDPKEEIEKSFTNILYKKYRVSGSMGAELASEHAKFAPTIFEYIDSALGKNHSIKNVGGYAVNAIRNKEYEVLKDKNQGLDRFIQYKRILAFESLPADKQQAILEEYKGDLDKAMLQLEIADCQEDYLLFVLDIKDKDIEKKARAAWKKMEESISNKTPVVDHSKLLTQLGELFVNNFGAAIFEKWLGGLRIYEVSEKEIIFQAPSKFLRDWIIRQFIETKQMLKVVNQALPEIKKVSVIVLGKKT